ncbi:MAG: hypothetical protein R3C40_08790 [Parvularculaceae bacterium]
MDAVLVNAFGHESVSRSQIVYPTGTLFAMKDSGLRIRVERELRERFVETCRVQDRPAAQVIREFMKQYVRDHSEGVDNEKSRPKKK